MPEAVAYVRDLLHGFPRPWFLCGGWAADAWLGRQTRDHGDVDIAVFHRDHGVIASHLEGWALVGHDPNVSDDTSEQWDGRRLDLPAHIHVPTLGSSLSTSPALTHSAFEFEFLLNDGSDRDVVLNPEVGVAVAREDAIYQSRWGGVPTLSPEVVLFFKAGGNLSRAEATHGGIRSRDEQDFVALLPSLTAVQRSWLGETLVAVRPDHPWLPHLG